MPLKRRRFQGRKTRNYGCKCGRISCPNPAARNGIFGCGDTRPKIATKMGERSQRQKSGKMSGRKSPQKPPIWRCAGNARFVRTGWWAHQGSNLGPAD
jgi:hypothetical protein